MTRSRTNATTPSRTSSITPFSPSRRPRMGIVVGRGTCKLVRTNRKNTITPIKFASRLPSNPNGVTAVPVTRPTTTRPASTHIVAARYQAA